MLVIFVIFMVMLLYGFTKCIVDNETLYICNKRNNELNNPPKCNRYMIRAHYEKFEMSVHFSFMGLTDHTPPKVEVIEKCLGFNELKFKKAIIKPQPWSYEVVESALNLIKEDFYKKIGANICGIKYDLYLLVGSDICDGYERKITNGTDLDIMNYSFSYDM